MRKGENRSVYPHSHIILHLLSGNWIDAAVLTPVYDAHQAQCVGLRQLLLNQWQL
jgi:hypothetical protein